MDQDVINLAKAIRQAESGNRAVLPAEGSKLGGASRYQYTHDTWKGVASKYLGNPNAPITLENENKATYLRIKDWKDKGYNPAQIASMHNAGEGRPDAYKQNWRGTNKYGVKYDTPAYVNKVYSLYKQQKGEQAKQGPSTQPPTVQMQRIERQQQGLPVARNENRVEPTLVGGMVREALGGGFAKLGESIRAIPKAIRGEDINKPRYSKYLGKEVSRIGAGFDVTKGLTKENLNAVKDSGAVGLEFASYLPIAGVASKTAQAIPALAKLPAKQASRVALRRIGMNTVEGAVGTAMYEGARRLQGEKDRGNFFENVAYGGVGGLALGTLGAGLSRGVRQARRTIASVGGNIPQDIAEESTQRLKGAWTELNDNYKDLRNFRNKQAKYGRNIEDVLTEEVMVPEIKDGKVDVQKLLPEIDARIQKQAEQVTEFAKKFDDMPVPIKDVKDIAEKVIRETPSITATGELKSALNEVARRMEGIQEVYGDTLVPSQLNTIRVQMNQLTKAFGGDVFKQDVADAIADAVRDKLDEVIQDDVFRRANAKVGDLINVRKYLQKVDGKQVGGGRFSQAFAGVVGAKIGQGISKLPVIGELAGYAVGRGLTRQARQYAFGSAGPRTRAILRRMQRKNEVGAEIAEKTTKKKQLLLPARTSDNNIRLESGRPINLPPRSQSSVDKTEMANIILQRSKKGDVFELNGKDLEITRVLEDGVMVVDNNGNKDFITKADIVGAKKVNPLFGEAEGEVVSEMLDLSVAGKRIMKEDGSFMAQKSTFPKWIPEDLRSMALFKSVFNKIKENKPIKGSREQRLYDAIKEEVTNRAVRKGEELAKAGEVSLAVKANEMSFEDFEKFYNENKAQFKEDVGGDLKKFWETNNFGGEQAFGAVAGLEIDENGELKFNEKNALIGVGGLAVAKKAGLLPKAGSVSDDLMKEARKYKSADEFVKAQGDVWYHGGDNFSPEKLEKGKNLFLADDYLSAKTYTFGKPVELYIPKKLKILDLTTEKSRQKYPALKEITKDFLGRDRLAKYKNMLSDLEKKTGRYARTNEQIDRIFSDSGWGEVIGFDKKSEYKDALFFVNQPEDPTGKTLYDNWDKIIKQAKKDGYDAIKANDTALDRTRTMTSLNVFDQSLLKTKSQLEEIWKKANEPKKPTLPVYKGEKDLTTKILKDLEGKTTVSKQYILDATNRGELKQVERDLIRQLVETEGDTINVADFAKKVKAELLPLTVRNQKVTVSQAKTQLKNMGYTIEKEMDGGASILDRSGDFVEYDEMTPEAQRLVDRVFGTAETYDQIGGNKYENIALPDDIRGNVKNYKENIYESPIKTSAGSTHFSGQTDNYFGHTRIEDMADNKTRRVIEVQSDLYQKGNLEREIKEPIDPISNAKKFGFDVKNLDENQKNMVKEYQKEMEVFKSRQQEVAKLQQYNDPTAHFRMIREEIKKAAQDGKTKLQFPTGETAMKIEGLGDNVQFRELTRPGISRIIKPDDLTVGKEIFQGSDKWIITDVLGDGKFKAVPKNSFESLFEQNNIDVNSLKKNDLISYAENHFKYGMNNLTETFDISGKVDTNNPIYKFYEKDVAKYLNKFGGKKVVDDRGVSWVEVPIKKEWAKMPVEAFAFAPLAFLKKEKVIEDNEEYKVTKSGFLGSKITFERKPQPIKETPKPIPDEKIGNALLQLESSGGTNKAKADPGEMKWLVGLTELAIEELKRVKKLPENFNKNNREKVIEAGIAYFKLMQERNPNMSPAEVYVDKYWTQWKNMPKPQEARTKKIEEFNKLVSL